MGQDAMKNCTDQEYWDTLVSQCIPCSLACRHSLARRCDAVCGECWAVPAWKSQGWGEAGKEDHTPGQALSQLSFAELQTTAKTTGGCDSSPWMGWGWQQLRRETRTKSLQLCTAPSGVTALMSPVGATPPSKGRAGEPPDLVDVDNDKPLTWDRH